jgi:hypothetical protein
MALGLSTPIPLRSGHAADGVPAGAAAHWPRRRVRRAGALAPQLTDASSESTTGCSVDVAPVGLVGDAMVGGSCRLRQALSLAGETERGAA